MHTWFFLARSLQFSRLRFLRINHPAVDQELRNLGRLATSRLALENKNLVILDEVQELLLGLPDGEFLSLRKEVVVVLRVLAIRQLVDLSFVPLFEPLLRALPETPEIGPKVQMGFPLLKHRFI